MPKISALTAVTTPAESDQFAVVQGGDTKKETLQQVREHITQNSPKATTHNIASDADYTLTSAQEKFGRVIITDTGVVLTTGRNVICSTDERAYFFQNDTAQTLTFKTSAGTGIAVGASTSRHLVCDGTNVLDPLENTKVEGDLTVGGDLAVSGAFKSMAPLLHIEDQKTSGTDGGDFNSGADRTRVLNTVVTNEITGASLSSNQITLPAGTYYIEWSAPALSVANHQSLLYNVTDTSEVKRGTNGQAGSADTTQDQSVGAHKFTIAGSKAFEIRHQCATTKATNGFGAANTFGTQVYTVVKIWQIG